VQTQKELISQTKFIKQPTSIPTIMIQTIISTFPLVNKPNDGAIAFSDLSRLGKRKVEFNPRMLSNKKRKMERKLSITLDIHQDSTTPIDNDGIFEWMDNMLDKQGNDNQISSVENETKNFVDDSSLESSIENSSLESSSEEDFDLDAFLGGSDPCYDDMLSLLAEDNNDCNDGQEDNIFRQIQESFALDRFPTIDNSSLTTTSLSRSTSINSVTRKARKPCTDLRKALGQLMTANRLTARTRDMLLNSNIYLCKKSSQ